MGSPMVDEICPACREPYFIGCKWAHEHGPWIGCFDGIEDTRSLDCGCIGHKGCAKDGRGYEHALTCRKAVAR